MKFNFITLFPEKIKSYFDSGLQLKAIQNNIFSINIINLRDFSGNKHSRVDDTIYGGGPGMLLRIEPIDMALKSLADEKGHVILTSPRGIKFSQKIAQGLKESHQSITIISGYYEGVDERVSQHLVDTEISIGNYVLSSGDIPALCIVDAVTRLIPGFMGKEESLTEESHTKENTLEYPQYTKPPEYNGLSVPEVLLSGNHAEIIKWREANRRKIE